MDLPTSLRPFRAVPDVWVERVSTTVQTYVRSDERPGSDGYRAGVDDGAVEVDEHVRPEGHVGAVVDVDGWFDPGVVCEELVVLSFGGSGRWQRR